MTLRRAFLWFWVGGLVLFAGVIALGMPLVLTEVPGGILDHQAAGSAAEVDRIQSAWQAAGLSNQASIAMFGDLVFIGIYGLGCVLGGLYFRRSEVSWMRAAGSMALIAGAVFLITDYIETIAQFIQLQKFAGDDTLAELAATVRPAKMLSWVMGTVSILVALLGEWRGGRAGD